MQRVRRIGSSLKVLASLKATVSLMALVAALLLLNVVLPQTEIAGDGAIQALASEGPLRRFFLLQLGFADMPSSPVFIVALVLFFFNLGAVLVNRTTATVKRIRARAPTPHQMRKLAQGKGVLELERPEGFRPNAAAAILRRLGYAVSRPDDCSIHAEKNRLAVLGFIVFHASFFLLCIAGVMLYYTRSVSSVVLIEGQTFTPGTEQVVRAAPAGEAPALGFTLTTVEPQIHDGQPIQLVANVETIEDGRAKKRTARVNHPASSGPVDLLVEQLGVALVVRLADAQGYIVDRAAVAVPTTPESERPAPLAGGELDLEVDSVPVDARFPMRDALGSKTITLRLRRQDEVLFSGKVQPGQIVRAGPYALELEELRYWVRFKIIAERGGWLLVLGFVLAAVGILWRMLLVRREVGLVWDDDWVKLFGRSEFYAGQFRQELETLGAILLEGKTRAEGSDA